MARQQASLLADPALGLVLTGPGAGACGVQGIQNGCRVWGSRHLSLRRTGAWSQHVGFRGPNNLNIVDFAHRVVGPQPLHFLSEQLLRLPGHIVPLWGPHTHG